MKKNASEAWVTRNKKNRKDRDYCRRSRFTGEDQTVQ